MGSTDPSATTDDQRPPPDDMVEVLVEIPPERINPFALARAALMKRYGTLDDARLREQGASTTELGAAETLRRRDAAGEPDEGPPVPWWLGA